MMMMMINKVFAVKVLVHEGMMFTDHSSERRKTESVYLIN